MKLRLAVPLLFIAAALGLAACGGDDDGGGSGASTSSTTADSGELSLAEFPAANECGYAELKPPEDPDDVPLPVPAHSPCADGGEVPAASGRTSPDVRPGTVPGPGKAHHRSSAEREGTRPGRGPSGEPVRWTQPTAAEAAAAPARLAVTATGSRVSTAAAVPATTATAV